MPRFRGGHLNCAFKSNFLENSRLLIGNVRIVAFTSSSGFTSLQCNYVFTMSRMDSINNACLFQAVISLFPMSTKHLRGYAIVKSGPAT